MKLPEGYSIVKGITHTFGKWEGQTALCVFYHHEAIGVAFTERGAERIANRHAKRTRLERFLHREGNR
jgi:hypothetical protein